MYQSPLLFLALVVLEIILEIDNVTALRRAAEGLPDTDCCRGQTPHLIALCVRVALAYALFDLVGHIARATPAGGHNNFEEFGGVMIVLFASALILNYFAAGRGSRNKAEPRRQVQRTTLLGFLLADAFLSLDTIIAAVAMTTDFGMAVTAMVTASLCIMAFHKPLQAWLSLNPRLALIAFCVIGLLGFNLILSSQGMHLPKYSVLLFVFVGVWLDSVARDIKRRDEEMRARAKARWTVRVKVAAPSTPVPGTQNAGDDLECNMPVAPLWTTEAGVQSWPSAPEPSMNALYAYGTTHSAAAESLACNVVPFAAPVNCACPACGDMRATNVSLCSGCGHYRFMCQPGIFEIGNLSRAA